MATFRWVGVCELSIDNSLFMILNDMTTYLFFSSFNSTNTFDLKKLRRRDASVESLNSPLCVWEEFHSSGLSSPTKQFKASAISNQDEISNNSCNPKYHLQILPQIWWKLSRVKGVCKEVEGGATEWEVWELWHLQSPLQAFERPATQWQIPT